uniref:Glycosyltransferase 2-like domain-containing protein n=1 Tax=Tetradesmus obliquus TaxID=3088 RepID=A0A383V9F4_TETOB|eukprot:jgi/Sobl393_1/18199/SZX62217.1
MADNVPIFPLPVRVGRKASSRDRESSGSGQAAQPGMMYPPLQVAGAQLLYESPKANSQPFQRHGFQTSVGGAPLGTSASGRISSSSGSSIAPLPTAPPAADCKHAVSWGSRKPLRKDASWFAVMAALLYAAATIYYLYVRIAFTLDMKDKWYSCCVLAVEIIGITAVIPYAALNCVHTHPTGSPGLPADDGFTEPDKKFTVRVLVPCYKESLGTVSATVAAAMEVALPPGVTRELYLCDDGKDAEKRAWLEHTYGQGHKGQVHYVTGRSRAKGEINGKSANLNNVLRNIIYKQYADAPGTIPLEEVVVVFDADMQAKPHFFTKILEVMCDDAVALCLSPQGFSNVNPATDIYNNANQQFWEYVLPGLSAMGYIACTGTNFCLRARALSLVGWFPEYCITEDYALSMELKAAGFKGEYLAEYLAVGEAPEELRNVLRQRSRWTKGHMQVFFSSRNPLLRWKLPLLHKLLYNNGTWSYFCTIITTWTFLLVPFISLMFEIQPVKFGPEFALAASLYLVANFVVMNYFHVAEHMRGIWMANVSNYLLSFTYAKAIANTLLSKVHIKKKAGFKPSEKTGAGGATGATAQIQSALMHRLTSLTRRFNQATLPQLYQPQPAPAGPQKKEDECIPDKLFMALCLSLCANTLVLGLHQVYVYQALTAWLALPMLWALYNAVPPLLFFGSLFLSSDGLHNMCFWMQFVSMLSGLGAVVCLWFVVPVVYTAGPPAAMQLRV